MSLKATVAGMISGTSAYAVNVALVQFQEALEGQVEFELLAFKEFPLSPALRHKDLDACANESVTRQVCELNFELGEAFAGAESMDARTGIRHIDEACDLG